MPTYFSKTPRPEIKNKWTRCSHTCSTIRGENVWWSNFKKLTITIKCWKFQCIGICCVGQPKTSISELPLPENTIRTRCSHTCWTIRANNVWWSNFKQLAITINAERIGIGCLVKLLFLSPRHRNQKKWTQLQLLNHSTQNEDGILIVSAFLDLERRFA